MSSAETPSPGDFVADKYRVERIIGQGGMGIVALADHVALSQRVAIKFLTAGDDQAKARFEREARAAVQLKSEHVTRVLDVGHLVNGIPYMVMEFLDGQDLSNVLEQKGALPVAEVAEYMLQACEAIGEAHRQGIIHRDLKPANLFLTHRIDGRPFLKVLDFGISKFEGSPAEMALTRTQTLLGTPLYMSPEQLRAAKNVDARSDIWSLGVVMFELLAGRVPFDGNAMSELIIRIVQEEPPALASLRADIPSTIAAIVMRCLEKDPSRRYQNVSELACDLESCSVPMTQVSRADRIAHASGQSIRPSPSASSLSSRTAFALTEVSWGGTGGVPTTAATGASDLTIVDHRKSPWPRMLLGGAMLGILAAGVGAGTHFARRSPSTLAASSVPHDEPRLAAASNPPAAPTPLPSASVVPTPVAQAVASVASERPPVVSRGSAVASSNGRSSPARNGGKSQGIQPSAKAPPAPANELPDERH